MAIATSTETDAGKLAIARNGAPSEDGSTFRDEKRDEESSGTDEKNGMTTDADEGETAATTDVDDYPHGLTLFFLILALSLGTLMMALDNVRSMRTA